MYITLYCPVQYVQIALDTLCNMRKLLFNTLQNMCILLYNTLYNMPILLFSTLYSMCNVYITLYNSIQVD